MAVTISSPGDYDTVPFVFTVSGTVSLEKGVPTMSGKAASGGNSLPGTVTTAPAVGSPGFAVKFDASAFSTQTLTWTVTINADYGGGTIDQGVVHCTTTAPPP